MSQTEDKKPHNEKDDNFREILNAKLQKHDALLCEIQRLWSLLIEQQQKIDALKEEIYVLREQNRNDSDYEDSDYSVDSDFFDDEDAVAFF